MKLGSVTIWLGIVLLAMLWATHGIAAGGLPWLPLLICGLGFLCAAHAPSRAFVLDKTCSFVEAKPHRWVLIIFGAALVWQLVGVELAFLVAGDVLAYVELLAAVSLISANARVKAAKEAVAARLRPMKAGLMLAISVVHRSSGLRRSPRTKSRRLPDKEPDEAGIWALA
jgi:hypothetical protein